VTMPTPIAAAAPTETNAIAVTIHTVAKP
jgi:hypothetical protein